MKKNLAVLLCLFVSIISLSCAQSSRNWSEGMRGMAEAYTKLLPFAYDSERYSDPNNEKFINLYLAQLRENAEHLNRHTGQGLSGDDPLFKIGLKGLKTTLEKASESYFSENYEYSQKLLQTSLNYCNSCHTRTSMGPTFVTWDQFENLSQQPSPIDKVKILVATRQFPSAVKTVEEFIQDSKVSTSERVSALKRGIFISLKNLESPAKAMSIIKSLDKSTLPKALNKTIEKWTRYLKAWPKQQVSVEYVRNNYLDKSKARKANHFVASIHESMDLHKYLSLEVDRNWRARAYHRLGNIYEQNPGMGFWDLPDAYYETCIHELPGTKIALKCYYSLEKILLANPDGLHSAALQKIEKYRLKKLKIMAKPSKNKTPLGAGGMGRETW